MPIALKDLCGRAEESQRQKWFIEAISIVAHDFKKPFNSLKFALGAILAAPESSVMLAKNLLPKVHSLTEDVSKLMEEVRDSTKPIVLNKMEVDGAALIEESLQCLKHHEKATTVIRDFESAKLLTVDAPKIRRALENILENAADASKSGKIWIRARETESYGRRQSTITIGNDSVIDPNDRRRIFDKYFSKNKEHGTGLGLYISKKIVNEHGGKIRCRSSKQSGTEFEIVLPAN